MQVIWKNLHGQSSRNHGTLKFFRNRLNCIAVSNDPKKEVDATVDILYTVIKGHCACACKILDISTIDGPVVLPKKLLIASQRKQRLFVEEIAGKVVDTLTLVDFVYFCGATGMSDTNDTAYNYARVLCHYSALVIEFRDAWREGDGERVLRCRRLFMPHFQAAQCTKYYLEALRIQIQINVSLSPNLAHQEKFIEKVNEDIKKIASDTMTLEEAQCRIEEILHSS